MDYLSIVACFLVNNIKKNKLDLAQFQFFAIGVCCLQLLIHFPRPLYWEMVWKFQCNSLTSHSLPSVWHHFLLPPASCSPPPTNHRSVPASSQRSCTVPDYFLKEGEAAGIWEKHNSSRIHTSAAASTHQQQQAHNSRSSYLNTAASWMPECFFQIPITLKYHTTPVCQVFGIWLWSRPIDFNGWIGQVAPLPKLDVATLKNKVSLLWKCTQSKLELCHVVRGQ